MIFRRALIGTILLFAADVSAATASPVMPVAGPVILARSGVQATYLWDATPYVTQLVAAKNVGDDGMHTLEATAVTVLRDKAASSHAKRMMLKVVYTRSGAVSPVYGTATFMGVEKVATFTVARDAVLKSGATWASDLATGKIPHDVKVEITGKLPPPQ